MNALEKLKWFNISVPVTGDRELFLRFSSPEQTSRLMFSMEVALNIISRLLVMTVRFLKDAIKSIRWQVVEPLSIKMVSLSWIKEAAAAQASRFCS